MSDRNLQRPPAVGLVVHGGRRDACDAAMTAAAQLQETGARVVGVEGDNWSSAAVELRDPGEFGKGLDVVLALGGDGTFLRAAYLARDCGVPLLGVNLGRLGFLSELETPQVPAAVGQLVRGDFTVEERMTLAVEVLDAGGRVVETTWALNDASVERTEPRRLIVLEVRVDETVFANVPADGLICATPTGSTAYAFSAGGPILSPLVDAILLTPVAPHSLFDRTLVVDPRETLVMRPVGGNNACVVSCDGRESILVPDGGAVRVSRGGAPVRLARLGPSDFYQRVRDKFGLV
ncbi:MAG: NAD(+)/NADH kinase [Actinomycetota bacterium]|nr:NAD(+)/NADH kinase [Actinomycetota bacterium]